MANNCDTTYKCVGNPKEIQAQYNVIKRNVNRKKPRVKNGFGTLWLGCIIDALGGNWNEYHCRGEILDFNMDSDATMITINQDTAWCEQEGFRQFIEERFPTIKVYYQEQEPGCGVFNTNSFDYFPEKYFIDSYEDLFYWEKIEDAAKHVSGIVGHEVEASVQAIDNALDSYIEEHEDEDLFYSFHEFQLVED